MPVRIQRQRTKGWRAPSAAIYCGRPTMYGNPFSVSIFGREVAVRAYRHLFDTTFKPSLFRELDREKYELLYSITMRWKKRYGSTMLAMARKELRGKDLMCWCGLSEACHVDVLLEISNS